MSVVATYTRVCVNLLCKAIQLPVPEILVKNMSNSYVNSVQTSHILTSTDESVTLCGTGIYGLGMTARLDLKSNTVSNVRNSKDCNDGYIFIMI